MKHRHKQFDTLVKYANAKNHEGQRLPIMLTGPAGTSKSRGAQDLAEELGFEFGYLPGNQQLTKSDLLGFVTPEGKPVDSLLARMYRDGGVFVLEEMDACNTNVILTLNAAIADSRGYFAGRMIDKHPDFVFIATANTYGGSTEKYNGRSRLDASTMSRFIRLEWGLDEDLETVLIGDPYLDKTIKDVRKELHTRGYELTMRDALAYSALLNIGIPAKEAYTSTILREVEEGARRAFDDVLKINYPSKEPFNIRIVSKTDRPESEPVPEAEATTTPETETTPNTDTTLDKLEAGMKVRLKPYSDTFTTTTEPMIDLFGKEHKVTDVNLILSTFRIVTKPEFVFNAEHIAEIL